MQTLLQNASSQRWATIACSHALRCRSFVFTAVFGLGIIWPFKGSAECLNFFTGFLVRASILYQLNPFWKKMVQAQ